MTSLISFICAVFLIVPSLKSDPAPQVHVAQSYVVSIKSRYAVSAYTPENTVFGTGFIVDVKNGIIVTNAHVAGTDRVVPFFEITLHDGREVRARLLYVDPWHDVAFLKLEKPDVLSDIKTDLVLEDQKLSIHEPVCMIGKNSNQHFSFQTGTIASLYETSDFLPSQTFRISLNAQGGASGSPVLNAKGHVVGILFASNTLTSAFAIPSAYIKYHLNVLRRGEMPKRYATGALLKYISLDDLVRYHHFSEETAQKYRKQFPDAFNRVLCVELVLEGAPAQAILEPGDVLTHVNGKEIGPKLFEFDQTSNQCGVEGKEVQLKIIRQGKMMDVSIPTYDLNARKIERLISFGGVTFYERDDLTLRRTAAQKDHRLFVSNIRTGSSFFEKLPTLPQRNGTLVAITAIQGQKVQSLDDLKKLIPQLLKGRDFSVEYVNYGVEIKMENLLFDHTKRLVEISYSESDGIPEEYQFKDGQWTGHTIQETLVS